MTKSLFETPDKIFDLSKRIQLGMQCLSNNVDKKRGYLPYFLTIFESDPAEARHDWPDFGDLTGRYVEAMILARQVLGIKRCNDTELGLKKLLLSFFDEADGLSYHPLPDQPYYSTIFDKNYDCHIAEAFDQNRTLWALLAWHEETQLPEIKAQAEQLVAAIDDKAVKREDYAYFTKVHWPVNFVVDQNAEPRKGQLYWVGSQIHPLLMCYQRWDMRSALELAQRFTNYIVYHSTYFNEDHSWKCWNDPGTSTSESDGHTHARLATLAGIITLGTITGERKLINWAKAAYDWFITNYCSSFGWSPEFLGRFGPRNRGCEPCTVLDQVHCAIALAEAGFPEYYEQAERFARNQLIESQILDTSLIHNTVEKPDTQLSCFHDVAKMTYGGFKCWCGPNDAIGNCERNYRTSHCCSPSGVKAMCVVWSKIYTQRNKDIFVNIFMNREDDIIKIENKQPCEGRLHIAVKRNCSLYLNKRSWMQPDKIRITVNNQPALYAVQDDYILIKDLNISDQIDVEYPLIATKEDVHVNDRDFTVTWQGDSVVDIVPPGKVLPLYQNRHNLIS